MDLDCIGARPLKSTERASTFVCVFVFDMSFVLLNPSKYNAAICANRSRLAAAHCTSSIMCDNGMR